MSTELSNPVGGAMADSAVPSYIAQSNAPSGTEELRKLILPPYLYIVQPQTQNEEITALRKPGDVLLMPDKSPLWLTGDGPIKFTPLLFYREWLVCNPLSVKPFVKERTTDPTSDIARRAQDSSLRTGKDETGRELSYVECLNFLLVLRCEGAPDMPVVKTFSKAEHTTGRKFINLITARNAPIYSGVYEFTASQRANTKGKWFGLDIRNCESQKWVSEEEFTFFRQQHESLTSKVKAGEVSTDYDGGLGDDVAGSEPAIVVDGETAF